MPNYKGTTYELPSDKAENGKLNRLRAAVLGANDGIVSVSSIVMGVAGATADANTLMISGLAALIAGALSMAVGEYVSVSSQSDAEKAYIAWEKEQLKKLPGLELHELTHEYMKHGVSQKTAKLVAEELTKKDALRAHLRMHFNLDPDDINSPWQAAIASLVAFSAGGLIPFLAMTLTPGPWRVWATAIAVLVALTITGYLSAVAGNASRVRAVTRVLLGGVLAMAVTYAVGVAFGTAIV